MDDRVDVPWWDAKPVAVVGTGCSLKGFDFRQLREIDCYVLAVNAASEDLSFANAVFSLDQRWIQGNRELLERLAATSTQVYLSMPEHERIPIRGVRWLRYRHIRSGGLSDDPYEIECGYSSGYGALNVAVHKRARKIVLLGFDYRGKGDVHYCPERYAHLYRHHQNWERWGQHFSTMMPQLAKRGVEVICATPESAITAFPRVTIEEGLRFLRERSVARSAPLRCRRRRHGSRHRDGLPRCRRR
jgi:hypothetical protein